LLVLGIFDNQIKVEGEGDDAVVSLEGEEICALDKSLGGLIAELVAESDFKAKPGNSICARTGGPIKRLAIVGMGGAEGVSYKVWKGLGSATASFAKTHKAATAAVALVGAGASSKEADEHAAHALSLGALLATFEDTRFKSKSKASQLRSLAVLGLEGVEEGAASARAYANGVMLTKQLVNAPPNVATPTHLAMAAEEIAKSASDVMSLKVLEKDECEKLGMGAFLGVAEASEEPPKFIHLTYTPPGGASDDNVKLAVIGKGLTFDSGGYNLKAGAGSMIEMMKFDMGGSGATLGAAKTIAGLKPAGVEVHFIVASCENMVAGKGLRPGDVLTASNGKTIEVNNTDAEGRLTLADALVYAEKQGVSKTVDIATLTGACMIALGDGVAGLFTPCDDMAKEVADAGASVGEKLWRMPMEESYMKQMESPIADMKNTGTRMGGAITAALFLKEYVNEMKWAHLDIAGPVWDDKQGGATGFGACSLAAWVVANSKKN